MNPQPSNSKSLSVAGWLTVLLPIGLMMGSAAADIVASLLVMVFTFHSFTQRDWAWIKQDWVLILLAVWCYGLIRALFAEHAMHTFLDAMGWLRFILLATALQYWVLIHPYWRNKFVNVGLLTMAWLAGDAIFQYIHGSDLLGHPYLSTPLRLSASYSKTIVGIMLAWQYLPYALADFERGKTYRALLLGVICFIAIALSGERMALIFSFLSLALLALRMPKIRRAALVIGLGIVLLTGGLMMSKPKSYARQTEFSTMEVIQHLPSSSYGQLWISALDIGLDHPLWGVGIGHYQTVCPDPRYGNNIDIRCAPHPHNLYLQWFSEGGLLTLLGFIAAFSLIGKRVWRFIQAHPHKDLITGLAITVFVRLWPIQTSTSFYHAWAAIPLWMMIGWMLAEIRASQNTPLV